MHSAQGDQIPRSARQIARLAHVVWMHVVSRRQARIQHEKTHAGCHWNMSADNLGTATAENALPPRPFPPILDRCGRV
eukprot:2530044-Pyramimonas_sp.AAC.1